MTTCEDPTECNNCDIDNLSGDGRQGMNWTGYCQPCSQHQPVALSFNIFFSIVFNAVITYTLQIQSVRTVYIMILRQLKFYPFSRLRPPFIMQGAYAKVFVNYLNYQSIFLYSSPIYTHIGMGSIGGIQGVVWFEDCYFINMSGNFQISLMHLPITVMLLFGLILVQMVLGTLINKRESIELKSFTANQLYQQHWYYTIGAPTLTLVFLPYMMCDTYINTNVQGSSIAPKHDCNSNTYTGLRWGMAFFFLLLQWLVLPYNTLKVLFVKRFELDRDIPTILTLGASFLEYKDDFFFWDCVKYFLKAACIVFVVCMIHYRLVSLLICIFMLLMYILAVIKFKPYKTQQLQNFECTLTAMIVLGFILLLVITQSNDHDTNTGMGYTLLTVQIMSTTVCFVVIVSTFCFPLLHGNRLLSLIVGVDYRPSRIRFPVVKKAWERIRTMMKFNILLKQLKLQTESNYNCTPQDLENYTQHVRKEMFVDAQLYRKRLGIPAQRNYSVTSPFERQQLKIPIMRPMANSFQTSLDTSPIQRTLSYTERRTLLSFEASTPSEEHSRITRTQRTSKKDIWLSPFKKMMYAMPAYKHDNTVPPRRIEQEADQEIVTFLFDEGVVINSPSFKMSYQCKVRIMPLSEMKNFLLQKALEKEFIDIAMEKDFAVNADKPICLQYQLTMLNLDEVPLECFKLAVDDSEEVDLVYLNHELLTLPKLEPANMTISFRLNLDEIRSHVFLIGQFRLRGQYYQFQTMLSRSLIKLAEIKQIEKSNQQFKNKVKFKLITQCHTFIVSFDHLMAYILQLYASFKENYPNITAKNIEIGNYDMQFLWKYYFPLKYLNDRTNVFFYQMLIDSSSNRTTIVVYQIREDDEENDKAKRTKAIHDGILQILKSYLMRS